MTIRLDAGNLTQTRSDLGLAIGTDVLAPNGSAASLTAIPAAQITGTLPAVNGGSITDLDANNLGSGTVPDARFPATLPATSGVNLTALNATNLGSGTVPDARFPATLPAASGVNLTALNATNLGSGTVATARLGTGTASASNFLRGDGSWQEAGGGAFSVKVARTVLSSGVVEVEFTNITKPVILYYDNLIHSIDSGFANMRFSTDNGTTYDSSSIYNTKLPTHYTHDNQDAFFLTTGSGNVGGENMSGFITICGPQTTTGFKNVIFNMTAQSAGGLSFDYNGVGNYKSTSAVNAFKVYTGSSYTFTMNYTLLELD